MECDGFSSDDAYFAINGAKMQLKEALSPKVSDNSRLINDAVCSLVDIKERGFLNVLGYKYCLAILCLHFWESIQSESKAYFFGTKIPENAKVHGLQLMFIAAKPKKEGGDDDYDAANYLQFCKK